MGKLLVSSEDLLSNDELLDFETRTIAQQLAQALDKNSVSEIKELKNQYGDKKEFIYARKFLDKKCKQVWNVFDNQNLSLPIAAMKSLGITNQPTLDFLLGDSIRYFEKSNGNTTALIIDSTLKNKNLSYSLIDIHNYLVKLHKKEDKNYNLCTIKYLITKQNYTAKQLEDIGANTKLVFKTLSLKEKLKYMVRMIKQIAS